MSGKGHKLYILSIFAIVMKNRNFGSGTFHQTPFFLSDMFGSFVIQF